MQHTDTNSSPAPLPPLLLHLMHDDVTAGRGPHSCCSPPVQRLQQQQAQANR